MKPSISMSVLLGTTYLNRLINFSPIQLFSAGEQGGWYDPSDMSTMFQDAIGLTPVTAAGQTVGLLLDKSRSLALGSERVTNGDYSAGATGWTASATGITYVDGVARFTAVTAATGNRQSGVILASRTYRVTFTVSNYSAGTVRVRLNGTTAVEGTIRSSNGTYTETITASATSDGLLCFNASAFSGDIDNVSVREIPGNHLSQATAANRPVYGVEPVTGRRNILLHSGLVGATSGTPGVAPTGWSLVQAGGTLTVVPGGGSLGGDALRFSNTATRICISQTVTLAANTTYTLSFKCNVIVPITISGAIFFNAPPAGSTVQYLINETVVTASTLLPVGESTVLARITTSTTSGTSGIRIGGGTVGSGTNDITIWDPQLELGSLRMNYQRTTTAFEAIEQGVESLYYLQFDGVNDRLQSAAITPTTDKIQIFAGVRKLADTNATIAEFSTNGTSNNGTAVLMSNDVGRYSFSSRGTTVSTAITSNNAFIVPNTSVLTGIGDIAADVAILKVNGLIVSSNTGDQGTGNYLAAPIVLGSTSTGLTPLNGRVYSLIVRFGETPPTTTTRTEIWIGSKTGVSNISKQVPNS